MERMKVLFTIVDRGHGIALSRLYEQNGVGLHMQIIAEGTATSEILDMLGLTHREKDMMVSFASEHAVENLLERLDDDYRNILSVRGIAFSIKLTAISGSVASALSGLAKSEGGILVHSEKEHSLIWVSMNQGYSDQVMHTARKAGATGGTVLRSRWVGAEKLEQFHAITLQDEREILMIACDKSVRNNIMDAINTEHGMKTKQQAVVFSLPIDRILKLS